MKRSMQGWIAAVLLAGPMAGHAAVIAVQGGFTSFYGCVGSGLEQTLNGMAFRGDGLTCSPTGNKSADFALSETTPSVTFQNYSFGLSGPSNQPNVISFTRNVTVVTDATEIDRLKTGEPFLLGWLTFTNGVWWDDASFGFTLTAYGGETFGTATFTGSVAYNLTPNVSSDPRLNADYLTFASFGQLLPVGELRAYELQDSPTGSNYVTAELWGSFGSLHLDSLRNATGGGFIVPAPTSVPEPGTMALLAIGLAGVGAARRRNQ